MGMPFLPSLTAMQRHQWIALHGQAGHRVECVSGTLWITQDNDRRDIVLQPGDAFVLDRPGMAMISAISDATLIVLLPLPAATPLADGATRALGDARPERTAAREGRTTATFP
jgi:hypothetical protein